MSKPEATKAIVPVNNTLTPTDRRKLGAVWQEKQGDIAVNLRDLDIRLRSDPTIAEVLNKHLGDYVVPLLEKVIVALGGTITNEPETYDQLLQQAGHQGFEVSSVMQSIDRNFDAHRIIQEKIQLKIAAAKQGIISREEAKKPISLIDLTEHGVQGLALFTSLTSTLADLAIHGDAESAQHFMQAFFGVVSRIANNERPVKSSERAPRSANEAYQRGEYGESIRLLMGGAPIFSPIELISGELKTGNVVSLLSADAPISDALKQITRLVYGHAIGIVGIRENLEMVQNSIGRDSRPYTQTIIESQVRLGQIEGAMQLLESQYNEARMYINGIAARPTDEASLKIYQENLDIIEGYKFELQSLAAERIRLVQQSAESYRAILAANEQARSNVNTMNRLGKLWEMSSQRIYLVLNVLRTVSQVIEETTMLAFQASDEAAQRELLAALWDDLPDFAGIINTAEDSTTRRIRAVTTAIATEGTERRTAIAKTQTRQTRRIINDLRGKTTTRLTPTIIDIDDVDQIVADEVAALSRRFQDMDIQLPGADSSPRSPARTPAEGTRKRAVSKPFKLEL